MTKGNHCRRGARREATTSATRHANTKEHAVGYLLADALEQQLLAPEEARRVGKRWAACCKDILQTAELTWTASDFEKDETEKAC